MLNYTDYLNRWNLYFAPHLPAGFPMPNYDEYVIREIQYFDFINLFTGTISYPRIAHPILGGGIEYIDVSYLGMPGLTYLKVGLYPWTPIEVAGYVNRKINYFMIGESGRASIYPTYFYDLSHVSTTGYIDAPCKVFGISLKNSKKNKLIALANKGVLLADFYPFGIEFTSKLRSSIDTAIFFGDFISKIGAVHGHTTKDLKIALVAPPNTSKKIISHSIGMGGLKIGNIFFSLNQETNNGINDEFSIWTCGTMTTSLPINSRGYLRINIPLGGYKYVHHYKKIAVGSGMQVPHASLLEFAFF